MKLGKSTLRFLALFLLATGAFFVLSNQAVKADTPCVIGYSDCADACWAAYGGPPSTVNYVQYHRCMDRCMAAELSCYAYQGWQNWLTQYNGNINDPFMIDNGPDPICAMFSGMLMDCGNYETGEEIEACVMMIQQEQARYRCP